MRRAAVLHALAELRAARGVAVPPRVEQRAAVQRVAPTVPRERAVMTLAIVVVWLSVALAIV